MDRTKWKLEFQRLGHKRNPVSSLLSNHLLWGTPGPVMKTLQEALRGTPDEELGSPANSRVRWSPVTAAAGACGLCRAPSLPELLFLSLCYVLVTYEVVGKTEALPSQSL